MKLCSLNAAILLVAVYLFFLSAPSGMLAAEMPLVYGKEYTGADCAKPPLPEFSALPSIPVLPDPFLRADGSRITTREEWRCRRTEIKAMLEAYLDKFLLGKNDVNTDILRSKYTDLDRTKWIPWLTPELK